MGCRSLQVPTSEISYASGRSVYSVRKDIRDGKLDPYNLLDVSRYVSSWRNICERGKQEEE